MMTEKIIAFTRWNFIGRADDEVKLQYFGQQMKRSDSLEKTLMLGKIEGGRLRG